MKSVTIYFPAVFIDHPQAGEYVSTGYATAIACHACGVVQPLLRVDLIHPCANPACDVSCWIELATAATN